MEEQETEIRNGSKPGPEQIEKIDLNKYWLFRIKDTHNWYCLSREECSKVNELAAAHNCTIASLYAIPSGNTVTAYPLSGNKEFISTNEAVRIEVSLIEPALV